MVYNTIIDVFLHTLDKEFRLCYNYSKGYGEIFTDWIDKNQPGSLLLHADRSSGSRQYSSVEGDGAIFWNLLFYCTFHYWRLRNHVDNILLEIC